MTRIRFVLLVSLSILLAAVIPLAAACLGAETVLFQPQPLLEALETNGFYKDYPHLVLSFTAAGGDILMPGWVTWLSQNFTGYDIENLIRLVFPEDWLRGQVVLVVSRIYDYANFGKDTLDLSLDLTPVKLRLTDGTHRQVIEQALLARPVCTFEESLSAASLLLQGNTADLPRCRLPDPLMPSYLQVVQGGMDAFAAGLPDHLRLASPRSEPPGGLYAFLRWFQRFSILCLPLLLLGIAALGRWSVRSFLHWSGPALYAGGLLALVSSAAAGFAAAGLLPQVIRILPGPADAVYLYASRIFLSVWREFLLVWAIGGAAAGAAGCGLQVLSARDASNPPRNPLTSS